MPEPDNPRVRIAKSRRDPLRRDRYSGKMSMRILIRGKDTQKMMGDRPRDCWVAGHVKDAPVGDRQSGLKQCNKDSKSLLFPHCHLSGV